MKQTKRLEVLTRVSDEQGQQLLEERKKALEQNEIIDEQNQRIDHQKQKIVALESGLNTTMKWLKIWRICSLVLLMVLMYKMMV
jgi:hypothetical protein